MHGPRILHYTGPNTTAHPRRAIILLGEIPHETNENDVYYPWMVEKRTLREALYQASLAGEP